MRISRESGCAAFGTVPLSMPKRKPGPRALPKGRRRTVRVVLSLRPDEHRRLERVARQAEVPTAVLVRDLVFEHLDDRERELDA